MGLGHKAGAADGHLHAASLGVVRVLVVEVYHLLGGLGNALDILHGLGGQTHHEVELDRSVARIESDGAGLFDFIPSDVFIDDVAQTLSTGLGGKGQSALAHLGCFFDEALGEVVHTQGGQRQADVLLGCPLVQIIQQLFQLTVVGGGKAGKAQFLVTGVGTQILCCLVQQTGIALAHGAVQKARLTEPAAAHAAAQHLDAGTILNSTHHGHHKVGGRGELVQILDDGLGDARRNARLVGGDGLYSAVLVVGDIVESRDVHARDLCNVEQQLLFGDALLFRLFDLGADGGQLVLALAQLDNVKEIRDRLCVAGAGAARYDQRPAVVTVFGIERDASQVQHGKDIGVGKLVLQGKAHGVKGREGIFALHGVQRQLQALHLRLHIQPRHKGALAPPVLVAVEQFVQDLFAQKGHSHLVGIREAEGKAHIHHVLFFIDTAGLAAGIASGLLHPSQRFFQFGIKHRVLHKQSVFCVLFILPQMCRFCNRFRRFVHTFRVFAATAPLRTLPSVRRPAAVPAAD